MKNSNLNVKMTFLLTNMNGIYSLLNLRYTSIHLHLNIGCMLDNSQEKNSNILL